MLDVLTIGTGPAGLAIAAACAAEGLHTATLSPDPEAAWVPRYGAWADELAGLDLPAACRSAQWADTVVHTPRRHRLGRAYVRLSTPGLQAHLQARCQAAGVEARAGRVGGVVHGTTHSRALLADGGSVAARVVIDASGADSPLVARAPRRVQAWQLAHGRLLRVPGGHPWPTDEMVLMDFRLPPGVSPRWRQLPTFLYAMPIDEEHVFLEETSLVHTRPPTLAELSQRLDTRLAAWGIQGRVVEVERCRIPMTSPAPRLDQRLLAYGAAASMVHPATGYQLARVLREAPLVAAAVGAKLREDNPQQAILDGWQTLWPPARRRSWALYTFGAEVLAALDTPLTQAFFAAFFRLAPARWQGFHSATLSPGGVARAMLAFFLEAPGRVRQQLVAASASRAGTALVRGMLQG